MGGVNSGGYGSAINADTSGMLRSQNLLGAIEQSRAGGGTFPGSALSMRGQNQLERASALSAESSNFDAGLSLGLKGGHRLLSEGGRQLAGRAYANGASALSGAASLTDEVIKGSTRAFGESMEMGTQVAGKVFDKLPLSVANNPGVRKFAEKLVTDEAIKKGGFEALEQAGKRGLATAAEKGVPKALVRAGGGALAKFVPGLNIAMAGVDSKWAWDTCNDPGASFGKKGMSLVNAGLSWVSATNIPLVSQGAAFLGVGTSVATAVMA